MCQQNRVDLVYRLMVHCTGRDLLRSLAAKTALNAIMQLTLSYMFTLMPLVQQIQKLVKARPTIAFVQLQHNKCSVAWDGSQYSQLLHLYGLFYTEHECYCGKGRCIPGVVVFNRSLCSQVYSMTRPLYYADRVMHQHWNYTQNDNYIYKFLSCQSLPVKQKTQLKHLICQTSFYVFVAIPPVLYLFQISGQGISVGA